LLPPRRLCDVLPAGAFSRLQPVVRTTWASLGCVRLGIDYLIKVLFRGETP
jgi:hypothetical protein